MDTSLCLLIKQVQCRRAAAATCVLMQHQVTARTQGGHRPRLLRLTSPYGFSQGEHGAGQIEIDRFLSQHG